MQEILDAVELGDVVVIVASWGTTILGFWLSFKGIDHGKRAVKKA